MSEYGAPSGGEQPAAVVRARAGAASGPVSDRVRRIADAVLYEGYVLWPYRRSALKNAQRWTFGGVYPRAHAEGRAPGDDPWTMQTQCLLEGGPATRVEIDVRFLHVVVRQVLDAGGRPVDELAVDGERHLTWEEATERELSVARAAVGELAGWRRVPVAIPAGREHEPLTGADGRRAGTLERGWQALDGAVALRAEPLGAQLWRLTVAIENATPWAGGDRAALMRRTMCSTHTVLHTPDGAFASLTDPPARLRAAAQACSNRGTWPVLAGAEGERDTLLSSPIILSDHPQVAPESPGDLFDGGEIDQLLVLNILSLTEAERAEVRATDPRARELLERTEALSREQLMRLHGRTVLGDAR